MNWELTLKFIAAVVATISASKVILEFIKHSRTNLRDEYRFAREFLEDLENEKLHPYALTKGYQALAGTSTVRASEVEHILSLENPVQCLRDFVFTKRLFERLETEGDFTLVFLKKYSSKFARSWRKHTYFYLYFICALLAFAPLELLILLDIDIVTMLTWLAVTLPFFGFYAVLNANAHIRFVRSEHLFDNQRQHTRRVILESCSLMTKSI